MAKINFILLVLIDVIGSLIDKIQMEDLDNLNTKKSFENAPINEPQRPNWRHIIGQIQV